MPISCRSSAQYRLAWDAITGLPMADQLQMHEAWGAYLGLDPGHPTKVARKRELLTLAIECLRRAAKHHHLPDGQAPIIREYQEAQQALELELSSHKIWRAFGGWRWAQAACVGEQTQASAEQTAHSRATRGIRRVSAPYIEQVKAWLDEHPRSTTEKDHENYVVEYNDKLPPGTPKLVTPNTVRVQLGISWEDAKAVARGEMSLDDAREVALGTISTSSDLALIGVGDIGRLRKMSRSVVAADTERLGFPVHVATVNGMRAWMLNDVLAYYDRHTVPSRTKGELQDEILDGRQMEERLHRTGDYLRTAIHKRAWHRIPQPAGQVSKNHYWKRNDVEQWKPAFKPRARRTPRPSPDQAS
jgi:hypothetical protein